MVDLSSLTVFADGKATKEIWSPPTAESIGSGYVLAIDQSFSSTGWVLFGRGVVTQAGTIKTASDLKGAEQDLARAEQLRDQVIQIEGVRWVDAIIYETPPTGPGVRHPEVSLLCALAVRWAARDLHIPVFTVHAKTGKKLVSGNSNADKKIAHAALLEHCSPWITGYHLVTNEGQRDALLVALAYLARKP